MTKINIFIQARMSSARFPGKVLAPFNGEPLIKRVLDRVSKISDINDIVVLTSTELSDNPLASYLNSLNCNVFRGDLNNVFLRFKSALNCYPCEYCVRICADSPLIDSSLLQFMVNKCLNKKDLLILSNVPKKSFPSGQSVEIIKSELIYETDQNQLTKFEKEHVLPFFYDNVDTRFCEFYTLENSSDMANMSVDSIDDLKRLECFGNPNICLDDIKRDIL